MPRFFYRAKDSALKVVEGTIEAESENAAIARLSNAGIYPMRLLEATTAEGPLRGVARQRVPSRPLAYLSRQLADLLGGGLPLFNALSLLAQQTEHRRLQGVVSDVSGAVRDGQSLSEALSRHPEVFSPLYVSMVRAGEAGGGLDAVLGRLAELLDAESELRSRVASALVYPLVVLAIGLLTIIVLLTYVVPKLTSLFTETGQLLPLATRALLAISGALTSWWWAWLAGLVGAVWALRVVRLSPAARAVADRLLLRLPLGGTLLLKLQTARFARNLGVMVGQGVPILQALEVSAATISNAAIRRWAQRIREVVQEGQSLSQALADSRRFPLFVSNMVAVGEESGTLDAALLKVAASYERETDRTLRTLTTVLEPLLIVVVGLVVMFIVISMLLPIFQLSFIVQ